MIDTRIKNYINSLRADLIGAQVELDARLREASDFHELTFTEVDNLKSAAEKYEQALAKTVEVIASLQRLENQTDFLEIQGR